MNIYLRIAINMIMMNNLLAQNLTSDSNMPKMPPPSRQVKMLIGSIEDNDFNIIRNNILNVWSLRDNTWVEFKEHPQPILTLDRMFAIKGPRFLQIRKTQKYQLAFISKYKGSLKYLWKTSQGQLNPIQVASIPFDDDIEIIWDIRVSPGIHLIKAPEAPSTSIHFGEPVVSSFIIQINSPDAQRIEIFMCGYREGKLVTHAFIPLTINEGGYSEASIRREGDNIVKARMSGNTSDLKADFWTDDKIAIEKRKFEESRKIISRCQTNALEPDEFVTDFPVLKSN